MLVKEEKSDIKTYVMFFMFKTLLERNKYKINLPYFL